MCSGIGNPPESEPYLAGALSGVYDICGLARYGLDIKMVLGIHVLVWDANDINAIVSHFVENQVHTFRETVVAGFYIRARFTESRILR